MYYIRLSRQYQLIYTIESFFLKYNQLTIEQIRKMLNNEYNTAEINDAIVHLLVDKGIIIRDDYWCSESVFKYVSNEYFQNSAFTNHYYSFTIDDISDKKFLLISDTHIGNSELENYQMLHNIYEFALQNGVTKCFHLGDIFSGIIGKNFKEEDVLKQFSLFGNFYPNFDKIKTYALIGNHDEYINGFFDKRSIPFEYDLRQLTKYSPNFYVIPRNEWELKFPNIKFHFSHRLYLNWMISRAKINDIGDIEKGNMFYDERYDILVSGHLHKGFLYNNVFVNHQHLYLGVPSTTNLNINNVVAYVVELNFNEMNEVDSMDITLLLCDDNNKIIKGETINWSFFKKNKILRKTF